VRPAVLGDVVRDQAALAVACEACGHHATLDPARLASRVGYDCAVPALRTRLRCSHCGSRRIDVQVRYAGPGVVSRHD
jgi:DNA-directed RNA polymerase subunit RPC12/RpoP